MLLDTAEVGTLGVGIWVEDEARGLGEEVLLALLETSFFLSSCSPPPTVDAVSRTVLVCLDGFN